jgi:hypothetical protein
MIRHGSKRLFSHRYHLRIHVSLQHLTNRYISVQYAMAENSATNLEQLEQLVAQQTELFNALRLQYPAGSPKLEDTRKKLSELKKTLGQSKKDDAAKDSAGKKKERLLLKTAKVSLLYHSSHGDAKGLSCGRVLEIMDQARCSVVNT